MPHSCRNGVGVGRVGNGSETLPIGGLRSARNAANPERNAVSSRMGGPPDRVGHVVTTLTGNFPGIETCDTTVGFCDTTRISLGK